MLLDSASMRYRRLGPTLRASEVGLGGAALSGPRGGYGLGVVGEAEARAVLEHA
jgi:aryl-alcohol dehydrogenase-like predicted oxidoreductase